MKIINIIQKINPTDLYYAVGVNKLKHLENLITDEENKFSKDSENLSKAVISIYGDSILYEPRIRHLIFNTLDNIELKKLAERYSKTVYDKPYDNALSLSLLPWKANSEFVMEISSLLELPNDYLPLKNKVNETTENIEVVKKLFPLHDYQLELKENIISELNNTTPRFLIQMPTGAGKTRTVLQSIIEYDKINSYIEKGKVVIWLAHTEELCEQGIDTFKNLWYHLSNYPVKVNRCWGNYLPSNTDVLGGFVFGTFQKFYGLLQSDSFLLRTLRMHLRFLVIDEAHKSTAKSYSKVIEYLISGSNGTLIGVTATPGRAAENLIENIELARFYNKKLIIPNFRNNPILELRNKGILSKINRIVITTKTDIHLNEEDTYEVNETFDLPLSTMKKLATNNERNKLILNIIEEEIKKMNPCLIFSCSIDHSKLLSAALSYKGFGSAYIDSNMHKGKRKKIIDDFKNGEVNVLFNYGVLSTGFDAPRIRTLIIARPTSSVVLYSQMIGRGLRGPKMGGAETCNLVDIKDNFINFGGVEDVYTYFKDYWN